MAKRLDCIVEGCHATIEERTEEEVMEEAEAHAAEAHPDLELDEGTIEEIRSNVRTV